MYRSIHPLLVLLSLGLCGFALACNPVGPRTDPRLCPQTYEFGNSGCVRVEGRVLGAQSERLHGVYVTLRPRAPGEGLFNTPVATTDAQGRFRLEAHRMVSPLQLPTPDTITMWLSGGRPGNPVVADSVPVLLHVAAVGQPAITVAQDLVLPVP
jgi:hypothetical protein